MSLLIPQPPKRQRALSFEEIEEEYEERSKRIPLHFSDEEQSNSDDESEDEENDTFTMDEIAPRFNVERVLGKGSFGLVVRAFDSSCGHIVAVKRLRHIFDTCEVAQRVLNEVKLLKVLGVHPNITSLFAVLSEAAVKAETYDAIYMVLEVAHSDLFKIMNSTIPLDFSQVQSIMHQTLIAVSWIHSHHVVHCDIKPANLLADSDCRIRLADFGLSRWGKTDSDPLASNPTPNPTTNRRDNDTLSPRSASAIQVSTKGARFLRVDSFCNDALDSPQHPDPVALECCYRSPEVLWPCDDNEPYRTSLDIWSVGCVFADLLNVMEPMEPTSCSSPPRTPTPIPLDTEGRVMGGHKARPPLFAITELPPWLGLMNSASIVSYSQESVDRAKSPVSANGRHSKSPRPQLDSFSTDSRRVLGSFLHVLGFESFCMKTDRLEPTELRYLSPAAKNFVLAAHDMVGSGPGTISLPEDAVCGNLLRQLLCFPPHLRPSAEEALRNKFFQAMEPVSRPSSSVSMPSPIGLQRALTSTLRHELWEVVDGPISV